MDEKTTIQEDGDLSLVTRTKPRLKQPSLFKVIILNDDYTPMEFVVEILEKFFDKVHAEATQIMLNVHKQGRGICGIYPHGIAETKVLQVNEYSRRHQYPLQCTLEKA
jgi:ATP-dependent Clp protease adaptor protein ClpS